MIEHALAWLLSFLRMSLNNFLRMSQWLWSKVLLIFRWVEQASAFTKALLLGLSILVIALVLAAVALTLRFTSPRSQMTVSAFQILDVSGKTATPDGKALADMMVDELHQILESAESFSGTYGSSRQTYGPVPDLPEIPVTTSFGIEVKGVSLDTIISTFKRIRYREFIVSGDLMRDLNGKSTIKIRYETTGQAKSFKRSLDTGSVDDIENAISELAVDLVKGISPQTAARYLLSEAVACSSPMECKVLWGDAVRYCVSWTQMQPQNYLSFYYLGYSLEGSGHQEDALIYLVRAYQLNDRSDLALIAQGKALMELGRFNEAETAFRTALKIRKTPNANVDLGILAVRTGRPEIAEWFYREALREDPTDIGALETLGDVLIQTKKYSDAVSAFNRALIINPTDGSALIGLARSLTKSGKSDEAIRQCEGVISLESTSTAPLIAEGVVLLEIGQIKRAAQELQGPAEQDTYAAAMFAIAVENAGPPAEADEYFRILIDQLPHLASFRSEGAMLHLLRARVLAEEDERAASEAEDAQAEELLPGARYVFWQTELLRNPPVK
jgi:tetratricopeptide (TPR) repeat protein